MEPLVQRISRKSFLEELNFKIVKKQTNMNLGICDLVFMR